MIARYIITACQEETIYDRNGKEVDNAPAPLHQAFANNLEAYARNRGAAIMVIPYAQGSFHSNDEYRITVNQDIYDRKWVILDKDMALCKFLHCRRFWISGQQINPLTGLARFVSVNRSAIIGSPKQHMLPVANQNGAFPKVLMSTGTCNVNNVYRSSAQGEKSKLDHTLGFIYVEVDTKTNKFHYRQVRALANGNFSDLDKKVVNGIVKKNTIEALVLGDMHTGATDEVALAGSKDMCKLLKPKHVVIHDLFDGASVNHHEALNFVNQARNYSKLDLDDELEAAYSRLLEIACWGKHKTVVVKSNHDEFLSRYLNTGNYSKNPRNLETACWLVTQQTKGKDPLYAGLMRYGKVPNLVWLKRDQTYKVRGVELGSHGDKGSNGSKGSFRNHVITMGKCITGHEHSPKILGDVYVVGTLTRLLLDYNVGPSAWMHTNAILHSDGTVQLINLLDGEFQFNC